MFGKFWQLLIPTSGHTEWIPTLLSFIHHCLSLSIFPSQHSHSPRNGSKEAIDFQFFFFVFGLTKLAEVLTRASLASGNFEALVRSRQDLYLFMNGLTFASFSPFQYNSTAKKLRLGIKHYYVRRYHSTKFAGTFDRAEVLSHSF